MSTASMANVVQQPVSSGQEKTFGSRDFVSSSGGNEVCFLFLKKFVIILFFFQCYQHSLSVDRRSGNFNSNDFGRQHPRGGRDSSVERRQFQRQASIVGVLEKYATKSELRSITGKQFFAQN